MGIGVSVFLMAVGAVITFALDVQSNSGFNLDTIGIILMVVGALGLLVSMVVFGGSGGRSETVVEERL